MRQSHAFPAGLLGAVAALGLLPSGSAWAMDDDEFRARISGHTVHLQHRVKEQEWERYFSPDGTVIEEHPGHGYREGRWEIDDGELCIAFPGAVSNCRRIMEDDDDYGTANRKGSKLVLLYTDSTPGNRITSTQPSSATEPADGIVETVIDLATRAGVSQRFLLLEPAGPPKGVVLLFPGHEGVVRFRKLGEQYVVDNEQGGLTAHETSRHILSRAGFAVAMLAPPSDHAGGMDTDFRFSQAHAEDVRQVIGYLRDRYQQKVYLHGHCRSSYSPPAVAGQLGNRDIAGLILSSTRSEGRHGSVMDLPRGAVQVPVLLVHHVDDPCKGTPYSRIGEVKDFYETSGQPVTLVSVSGGDADGAHGCSGGHHGFKGQRTPVMEAIVHWLSHDPVPATVH